MLELLVGGQKHVEHAFRAFEQFAVLHAAPAHLLRRGNFKLRQTAAQRLRHALVEEDFHAGTSNSLLLCSSTAMASSRRTVGKQSRNSSSDRLSSRYSNSDCTGTRGTRNTGAPLMISGSTSIGRFAFMPGSYAF